MPWRDFCPKGFQVLLFDPTITEGLRFKIGKVAVDASDEEAEIRSSIHIIPGNVEWHAIAGGMTVLLLSRSAKDFRIGDDLIVEGRGAWTIEGIESARDGKGKPTDRCSLVVEGFADKPGTD